ncbi:MAG: hypothetical protein M5U27_04015 [Gaiella sp.]|nr:hypothetical protein [Gaiella sp.]
MKRAAVIAVQVAAAVLVGLAIRELWLAGRGEGDAVGPPARAVAVTADVAPDVVAFGTPVVATADVVVDATVVDPKSIVLLADFTPYEVAGTPTVQRRVEGATAHVSFRYTLRCLREGCEPAGARGVAQFRTGLVRYRFNDTPGTGRDVVDWPPVIVASRVAAPAVETIDWRADRTELPAVTSRVSPWTLAVALLLGALALAVCAVWLGRRLWHEPPALLELAPRDERPALERALELARAEVGNGAAAPDRRRALERVARELDVLGHRELADEARALAWSPRPSTPDEIEGLARRAETAAGRGAAA